MNSKIYITLKRVGFKPEQFRQLNSEAESSYNNLLKTLKDYQLKAPETLEKYCITAFNQITAEQTRIIELLEHFDKTQTIESKYYSTDRLYLTEILNFAGSAKAAILEHLAVYRPDLFSGNKIDLIREYLPPFNEIRKQIEASQQQQPTPEPEYKPKNKPVLLFPQIALLYVFENRLITRDDCREIAQSFKHEAKGKAGGLQLYYDFAYYSDRVNRRSIPNAETRKTMINKINLFQSVIDYPNISEQAKQTAIEELNTLKTIANKHFGLDL